MLKADGVRLAALYTPGHTEDSYSFAMGDRVFTGDTLLIRGTGRTDFQNGDPGAQYDGLFNKLLVLPEDTPVYPAHDYEGRTSSSIGEEKRHNPRLPVRSTPVNDGSVTGTLITRLGTPAVRMLDTAGSAL